MTELSIDNAEAFQQGAEAARHAVMLLGSTYQREGKPWPSS